MNCPNCNKASNQAFKPFCSKRCADLDLGKWFTGSYALPSDEPLSEEEVEQIIELLEPRG